MIENLAHITELLQYFTSSSVTFATADNSIAATGIGTAFPANKILIITGASETGNNSTFTVVSATANKIIVSETVTAESAGAAVVINQEYRSGYKQVFQYRSLVGGAVVSQNAIVYIDQSNIKDSASYTTTYNVTSGNNLGFEISVVAHYAQIRVRNSGVDQTSMNAYLNGRR